MGIKLGLKEVLAFTKGDQTLAKVTTVQVSDDMDIRKIRKQSGLIEQGSETVKWVL